MKVFVVFDNNAFCGFRNVHDNVTLQRKIKRKLTRQKFPAETLEIRSQPNINIVFILPFYF